MEDYNDKVNDSSRKRLRRKPKRLEFVGWGSKNLIEFLESLGRDTTNRVSENDVTEIIRSYIREANLERSTKKGKTVVCDTRLRLLFGTPKFNRIKVPDLVDKHYVENQDDSDYDFLYKSEDDEQQRQQQRLSRSDKIGNQKKQVVQKPKETIAAIVRDNIKLLYLRKSLVQELAKTPETFESKVMGTFVRIKNPCQLVQVTGVKEGNPIDGYFLQVTDYSYYLKDAPVSTLSDDDFPQEECEELHQRIKNGCVKRLTVVDMEEKVRNLHEVLTKHWIARELVSLQRLINQANEKGWGRELSQYLDKRELLQNPEEQSRLLREVPEVVAEEIEPECVDDDDGKIENDFIELNLEASLEDQNPEEQSRVLHEVLEVVAEEIEPECVDDDGGKIENDFIEPNPEASLEDHQSDKKEQLSESQVSSIQKTPETSQLRDGEDQPTLTASAGDKDLHEDVFITKVDVIDPDNERQAQPNPPEIIELSDDDDDDGEDKGNPEDIQHYDPKKVVWFYELPKGQTRGPFSLANLKEWSEFFVEIPDFKVWMRGESRKSGVLLTKLLPLIKT